MGAQLLIFVGILLGIFLLFIMIYNRLVTLRNRYKNAFAQIDVQLKRRYDLIPNLVETAKGFLKHERETLEAVISARNSAYTASKAAAANPGAPDAMKALMTSETVLLGSMGKMFALAEAYPDLKSNSTMNQLMEELTSTENKVSFSRQAYNDAVTEYNTSREAFPGMLLAGMFGAAQLFEIEDASQRQAVKVSFS